MGEEYNFTEMDECSVIVDYIENQRHNRGLHTHILTTGLSGTGKSSVDQRLGELISIRIHGENTITIECVCDSLLSLLARLRKVKRPGEIIIVEEVGVLFPSRRAMSKENVSINKIMDTIRKKQVILLSNAPLFPAIDSHMRAMGHILLETQYINKTQDVVVFKGWKLQTNPHTSKCYRHKFTRKGRDVALFFTKKPNTEVWKQYEDSKDKFIEDLYSQLEHEEKIKKKKLEKSMRVINPEIKALSKRYLKIHDLVNVKGMRQREVAKTMGLSEARISQIMKELSQISKKPKEDGHISLKKL